MKSAIDVNQNRQTITTYIDSSAEGVGFANKIID